MQTVITNGLGSDEIAHSLPGEAFYIDSVTCSEDGDVSISQIEGALAFSVMDRPISLTGDRAGPLLIQCSIHGTYLGFLQFIERSGPEYSDDGSVAYDASALFMFIPCGATEHVQ